MGMGGLQRGELPAKPKNPWQGFKRMLPWLLPYWPVIIGGLICMGLNTYLTQQPPLIIRYIVDYVVGKHHYERTLPIIGWLLALFAGLSLTDFLRTYWMHMAGQKLLHTLRVRLYEHFQKLPLTYYDSRQTGDLMSRMTGDVEQIEQMLEHGLDILLMGLLGMALTFFYIWRMSHTIAWLVLLPIPIFALCIYFFSRAIRSVYRSIRDRVGDLNAKLQENFSGIRVIKAFSREGAEYDYVSSESEAVMTMNVRAIRMWSSFGPAMGFLTSLGRLIAVGASIYLIMHGQFTAGSLVACYMFVQGFYGPIGSLFQFFDSITRSLAAGERLFEVFDTVPDIQDPEHPQTPGEMRGQVEFRQVSFRYATGEQVLHDVNVLAEPGERIALVGRSGAGKSSFINLIPRFYDVLDGVVLVDGLDVRTLRQYDLRRHMALVLQETFLFNGTVKDNLRYGRLEASDEEIIAAARAANADEFITRLPEGYETEIGERGVKLSGGQRQRLSIARAVLADPKILILDEATSSVDSESEFLIHQALERLMDGRTTFIIAHRLSTIKHANLILVLEDGGIVERGSHDALIRQEGVYAQMYRQQFWLDELFKDEVPEEVN